MMNTNLKNLIIGTSVSTFKVEHDLINLSPEKSDSLIPSELKAIAVLLGGYNTHGRSINFQNYQLLKEEFEDVLKRMQTLLIKNN